MPRRYSFTAMEDLFALKQKRQSRDALEIFDVGTDIFLACSIAENYLDEGASADPNFNKKTVIGLLIACDISESHTDHAGVEILQGTTINAKIARDTQNIACLLMLQNYTAKNHEFHEFKRFEAEMIQNIETDEAREVLLKMMADMSASNPATSS